MDDVTENVEHEPTPIDLVRQLRVVLGMPSGALAMTPKAAWDEAIERVHNLTTGRCSTCLEREGRHWLTAHSGRRPNDA